MIELLGNGPHGGRYCSEETIGYGLFGGSTTLPNLSSSPYDTYVVSLAPLGHWKLNEKSGTTAYDSSGHGNHGTYTIGTGSIGVVTSPIGGTDTAFSCDGTTSQALTPLVQPAGDFSIIAWYKNVTGVSFEALVNTAAPAASDSGFAFFIRNVGAINLTFANRTVALTNSPAADASWHMLVGTSQSGTTMKFFLDSANVGVTAAPATNPSVNPILIAGAYSGNPYYNGYVSRVTFFNRVLTPTEIDTIWANR